MFINIWGEDDWLLSHSSRKSFLSSIDKAKGGGERSLSLARNALSLSCVDVFRHLSSSSCQGGKKNREFFMGLHQMFWIKREMVVKGREREKVHRRRVTHYPRCLAGSSLVILFQFPSALREREEYADVRQRAAASRTNVLGQGRPLCVLEFLEERRPQNPVSWYLLESGVYVDTLCYLEWMTTGDKVDTSVTTTTSFCFHFRLWRDVDAWWWRFLPFRNVVLFFLLLHGHDGR